MGNILMTESSIFSAAGQLIRKFSGQVAMSVAVSASVAALPAAPEFLFGHGGSASVAVLSKAGSQETASWTSPVAPDGKIRDRHRDAASADLPGEPMHLTPASLAMPMVIGWPQPAFAQPRQIAAAVQILEPRVASVEAPPAKKLVAAPAAPERPKLVAYAAPLPITPPAAARASIDPAVSDTPLPPAEVLGRAMPEPVARAANVVSGAAGLVGAAGSWTVSQASHLLPRW